MTEGSTSSRRNASFAVVIVRGVACSLCLLVGGPTVFLAINAWWQFLTVSRGEPDRVEIVTLIALLSAAGSLLTAMSIGPVVVARWVDVRWLWMPALCFASSVICIIVVTGEVS